MLIQDGQGRGFSAAVEKHNQLLVLSASHSLIEQAAATHSDAYAFVADDTALTAGDSGLLRILNTNSRAFVIEEIIFSTTIAATLRLLRNVTTGTLVSAGSLLVPPNTNFGSGKLFDGALLVGTDGSTVTNGELLEAVLVGAGAVAEPRTLGAFVLPANTSFTITAQVTAGGNVAVSLLGYYPDTDD